MPFLTVKIQPSGVKAIQTPTLLSANVVASNLIRWRGGLPEKIGGWMNFFTNLGTSGGPGNVTVAGVTRDMCAWADLDIVNHLAIAGTAGLNCFTPTASGTPANQNITPQYELSTSGQTFSTAAGSPIVTIYDPNAQINDYGTVQIQCHVAVGGIVLFGSYPIVSALTALQYTINAGVNAAYTSSIATTAATATTSAVLTFAATTGVVVGEGVHDLTNPAAIAANTTVASLTSTAVTMSANAAATVASGDSIGFWTVATFTTTANSQVVEVYLPNHGFALGSSFALPMPTKIGANGEVTLQGFYVVQQVIDANHFIIFAQQSVPTAATVYEGNLSGAPQLTYWVTQAPPLPNSGWGVGGWGVGGWGSGAQPVPLAGNTYPPPVGTPGFSPFLTGDDWQLANWGSQLIACAANGPLFQWDPTSGIQNGQRIANGPSMCTGFFIGMPEQQIITYGASTGQVQDPMLVAWCDNANYNTWVAAVSNQAGTFRLARGSKIIGGIQGPQQAMLWTDVGLWVMAYVGYPNVFGFSEVAQGCGLIAKHAVAVYGPQVFWMGRDSFWMYTNGVVQRVPCDVWDIVIKNINNTRDNNGNYIYWSHIRGAANSGYDEVAWHFPSQASTNGENDSFVKFNPVTGEWDYSLSTLQQGMVGVAVANAPAASTPVNITAWLDNNIFGHPISSMITGPSTSMIYQHEMGMDANGSPINWMIQTGFFMLSDGEDKVFVDFMLPDFRWRRWQQPQTVSAQVQITLYTAEEPDDPQDKWIAYGPFLVTNATGGVEPRCRGRYFFMQAQGNDLGSFARLGGVKFRFAPDGRN